MAFNVNRLTLVGRLGSDAEFKSFQNGGGVVNFRIATSETWKDRQGVKQERTEWTTVAVFAKWLIDDAQKLRKGDMVMIEGKLQTRKWQDQSGNDRYATECVLTGFEHSLFKMAPRDRQGGAQSGGQSSGGNDWGGGGSASGGGSGGDWGGSGGGGSGGFADDLDDDIPF
jgi:single-strand DNA-binding protein